MKTLTRAAVAAAMAMTVSAAAMAQDDYVATTLPEYATGYTSIGQKITLLGVVGSGRLFGPEDSLWIRDNEHSIFVVVQSMGRRDSRAFYDFLKTHCSRSCEIQASGTVDLNDGMRMVLWLDAATLWSQEGQVWHSGQ